MPTAPRTAFALIYFAASSTANTAAAMWQGLKALPLAARCEHLSAANTLGTAVSLPPRI